MNVDALIVHRFNPCLQIEIALLDRRLESPDLDRRQTAFSPIATDPMRTALFCHEPEIGFREKVRVNVDRLHVRHRCCRRSFSTW